MVLLPRGLITCSEPLLYLVVNIIKNVNNGGDPNLQDCRPMSHL